MGKILGIFPQQIGPNSQHIFTNGAYLLVQEFVASLKWCQERSNLWVFLFSRCRHVLSQDIRPAAGQRHTKG